MSSQISCQGKGSLHSLRFGRDDGFIVIPTKRSARRNPFLSILAVSILLVLGPLFYFRVIKPKLATAAWFNDSWGYRKAVQITNSSGGALTDFQVSINIGTSALIASGKMQSNCNDVRITDTNGKLLPHWIEENNPGCNVVTDTKVWVKVPSIPSSGGTVYVYYGNPSATNVGNGNKVFEFFDDFNDGTINSSKWTQGTLASTSGTSISESGGNLVGGNTNRYIQSVNTFTGNYIAETRVYETSGATNGFTSVGFYASLSNCFGILIHNGTTYIRNDASWPNIGSYSSGQWTRDKVQVVGTSGYVWHQNESTGVGVTSPFTNSGINSEYLRISPRYDDGAYDQNYSATWDWVFVRKAVATEPSTSSGQEELSKAPAAYWSFDDGQGSVAQDKSSNNNDGTLGAGTSAPTWQTEDMCISGKCLKFDGSNDYIDAGTNSSLNITGNITLSAWIKTTDVTSSQVIIGKTGEGYTSSQYELDVVNSKIKILATNGTVVVEAASASNIENNKWYYVVGVINGNTFSVYVNGVKGTDGTLTGTKSTTNVSTRMGRSGHATSGFYFNGFLDEVKIYPYARSAAEIKSDYNAGKAHASSNKGSSVNLGNNNKNSEAFSDGLVGYWKMDETSWNGTPGEVLDSSGVGNTGVGVGTTKPTTGAGKFGNGGMFNGVDNSVDISNSNSLAISGDLTISAWVNRASTGQNQDTIVYKDYNKEYEFFVSRPANALYLYHGDGSYTGIQSASSSLLASYNTWLHVVVTRTLSPKKVNFYINGALLSSHSYTITPISGTNPVKIGLRSGGPFNGSLDEVRIYNRALSPAEVRNLYNWAPGPYTYLSFDEGSGNNIYDKSGNGYSGTWNGSGTHWTNGKFGKAGKFNGSTDYVSFASLPKPANLPVTIEFWTQPTTSTPVGIFDSAPSSTYTLRNYSAGNVEWWPSAPIFALGLTASTWTHLAFIYDYVGGNQTITWYKNGIQQTTASSAAAGTWAWTTFILGNINNGSAGWYSGNLDEFKIYNYARSAKQITEDMNAGHPAVGSPVGSAVAHYKFDEGYGTTLNNSGNVGTSLNGTFGSSPRTPSWTNNGKYGKALSFDASTPANGDIVNVPDNSALQVTTGLTISAWINPNTRVPSQTEWIVGRPLGVSPWDDYNLVRSGNNIGMSVRLASGMINATATNAIATTGNWYHLLGTYDAITGKLNLYINGQNKSSASGTGNIQVSSTRLKIGCWGTAADNCDSTTPFNGLIDDVKIYNYALTEDEILTDFNRGSALILGSMSDTSGLTGGSVASQSASAEYCIPGDTATCSPPVGRWDFEEGTGTSAFDTSGNGNNGVLGAGSSAPTWAAGKYGKALRFDGSNDYVSLGDPSSLEGMSSFSFNAWVYPLNNASETNILHKDQIYQFAIRNGNFSGAIGTQWAWQTGPTVPNGQWSFVSGVWDGDKLYLYLNGALKNTFDLTNGSLPSNSNNLCLGNNCGSFNGSFTGSLDQVRIYNYARSPAQIAWDYNRGKPIAYFDFDKCQGTLLEDSIGPRMTGSTAFNGTITVGASGTQSSAGTCALGVGSSTAWGNGATGKYNSSLNFDGTDDLVSIGTGVTVQSILLWIKPTTNSSSPMQFATGIGISAASGVITAPGFTSPTIYVNGVVSSTLTAGVWQQVTVTTATGIPATAIKFGLLGSTYYSGQIDEAKLYNYALTSTQVKTEYNQGAVRFGPGEGSP